MVRKLVAHPGGTKNLRLRGGEQCRGGHSR